MLVCGWGVSAGMWEGVSAGMCGWGVSAGMWGWGVRAGMWG